MKEIIVTAKQKHVLDALIELTSEPGQAPTLADLRDYLGYANTSSVQRHIYPLIRKGLVAPAYGKSRSYRALPVLREMEPIAVAFVYRIVDTEARQDTHRAC